MRLLDGIEEYFLRKYRDSDYLIRVKARILLAILMISVGAVFVLYVSLMFLGMPMIHWHFTLIVMMLVPVLSIILLKKGKNFAAANIFISVLASMILLGTYLRFRVNPGDIYMTTFYLVAIVIMGSSIFCKIHWLYIYSSVFIITNLLLCIVTLKIFPDTSAVFRQGFVYTMLNVIIIFLLSLFIRFTANKALRNVNEELDRNMVLNRCLDERHRAIQDLSSHLYRHFTELKENSSQFAESSQTTAASIEEISSASEEVMSGVEQVFTVVEEQRGNLIVLLESMHRLSSISSEIGEQINMVNSSTTEITSMAIQGNAVLAQLHAGMKRISESSQVIENIVEMINDIADKINLLSLNASIEAARAGDSGKGFAVVADEISRLGNMTQSSMNEINKQIQATNDTINSGLGSVELTVTSITKIIESINGIIKDINEITNKTRTQREINLIVNSESDNLRTNAEQIKDMMEAQHTALNEIVKSITDISMITQTFAARSRQLHSEAENIESMSGALNNEIRPQMDGFRADVHVAEGAYGRG